jgi:hypothetical protein
MFFRILDGFLKMFSSVFFLLIILSFFILFIGKLNSLLGDASSLKKHFLGISIICLFLYSMFRMLINKEYYFFFLNLFFVMISTITFFGSYFGEYLFWMNLATGIYCIAISVYSIYKFFSKRI